MKMSNNLYLFDPKQAQANTAEKPLIPVMHEAEIARAQENARIFQNLARRVSGLFSSGKPATVAKPAAKPAANPVKPPVEKERLAA
jgi:hypothetical protein